MAGLTVTAGNASGSGVGTVLAVDVLGGAADRDSQPTHQFEAEASTHPPGGTALFNAAGTGSYLYAAAEYGPATAPGGVTTGTRVVGFSNASIGAGLYRNTAGTTAGSSVGVSIGDTTPTCVAGEFVCAEITRAAGATISLIDSQTAQGTTPTVTTPPLSTPPGALLVAYFGSYDGGAGVVGPVITDSWGLQWRQVSVRNTTGNGVAAIYVAQVPTSPPPVAQAAPKWFPGAPGLPLAEPFTLPLAAAPSAPTAGAAASAPAGVAAALATAPQPTVLIAAEPGAASGAAAAPAPTVSVAAQPPAATGAAGAPSPAALVDAEPPAATATATAPAPAPLVSPSAGAAAAAAAAQQPAAHVAASAGASGASAAAPQPAAHVFANAGLAAATASAGDVTATTATQTSAPAGPATATATAPSPAAAVAANPSAAVAAATVPAPAVHVLAHAGVAAATAAALDVTLRPPGPVIATGHGSPGTLEPRSAGVASTAPGAAGTPGAAEPATAGTAGLEGTA